MTERTTKAERKQITIDALATLVFDRFKAAVQARTTSGVSELMVACRRAAHGQPITGRHANPEFPVIYDVTNPITRGLEAILNDTLTASTDNLFVLQATENPELNPDEQAVLVNQLEEQYKALLMGVSPSDVDLEVQAQALIEATKKANRERAQRAAEDLRVLVKDKLQEGGFDEAFRQGLHDLVHNTTMVLKAPSPRLKRVKVWNGTQVKWVDKIVEGVERIDPLNIYPAPNAVSAQTADYIIELRTASPNELAALAASPGYDPKEIIRVFSTHPSGFKYLDEDCSISSLKNPDANTSLLSSTVAPYNYDILVHYGRVRGGLLAEYGVDGLEDHLHYEAEIMVIDKCVIRAELNTDPAGRRPYYHTSYDPVDGSFWGGCPVSKIIPIQRAATSTFVQMLADIALAGIHVEVDVNRLDKDDRLDKLDLRPRVVRLTNSSPIAGNNRRAYDIYQVETQAAAFRETLRSFEERAYDVVGLQRFAIGQTTGVGTVGRTAGGLASLMNQASKGIKQVLRNLERHIIEPVVQHFVDSIQTNATANTNLMGDIQVRAMGLTEVAENAGQAEDLQWALQTIASVVDKIDPVTQQPIIPVTALRHLIYKLFKTKGIPTDGVFPLGYEAEQALQTNGGGPVQPKSAPDVPNLDGRSEVSAQAIQEFNDPMGLSGGEVNG